uniref:Secreted protein n=1 Tax=Neolamprologus brichardi TaxID=32507 RepID=A0A3Q4HVD7_NEOBR
MFCVFFTHPSFLLLRWYFCLCFQGKAFSNLTDGNMDILFPVIMNLRRSSSRCFLRGETKKQISKYPWGPPKVDSVHLDVAFCGRNASSLIQVTSSVSADCRFLQSY